MPVPQGGIFGGEGGGAADGILGQMFGRVQQAAMGYANSVAQAIVPWVQRVGLNLVTRAAPMLAQGQPCECQSRHQGQAMRCSEKAALSCETCRRRVCMGHVFVSWRADAVCWQCVAALCQARGVNAPTGEAPQDSAQGEAPAPPGDARKRALAFQMLGLKEGASERDVRAAHRALAARYHPDGGKEANADRAKAINSAFQYLLEHVFTEKVGG